MYELWEKIKEALVSALPITLIVYGMALTPLFDFSRTELITFTVGVGISSILGDRRSQENDTFLILFGLITGILVVLAEPAIHVLNGQVEEVTGGSISRKSMMPGLGTASSEIIELLGLNNHKAVILSVAREDMVPKIMNTLEDKFRTVRNGKGIAFSLPVSDVAGLVKEPEHKEEHEE